MDSKYTNVTLSKETAREFTSFSKSLHVTKDEALRKLMKNYAKNKVQQPTGLMKLSEKYKKKLSGFKATENINLDDIDISEAYL